jgi:hypothetical protein
MKIDDELLEALGNLYTQSCSSMSFEKFVQYALNMRQRRGLAV